MFVCLLLLFGSSFTTSHTITPTNNIILVTAEERRYSASAQIRKDRIVVYMRRFTDFRKPISNILRLNIYFFAFFSSSSHFVLFFFIFFICEFAFLRPGLSCVMFLCTSFRSDSYNILCFFLVLRCSLPLYLPDVFPLLVGRTFHEFRHELQAIFIFIPCCRSLFPSPYQHHFHSIVYHFEGFRVLEASRQPKSPA